MSKQVELPLRVKDLIALTFIAASIALIARQLAKLLWSKEQSIPPRELVQPAAIERAGPPASNTTPDWYRDSLAVLDRVRHRAEVLKSGLQMIIGGIIVLVAVTTIFVNILAGVDLRDIETMEGLAVRILAAAGVGLVFSTVVELAYLLYTEGPDEALTPVATGLAAVLLLRVPSNFTDISATRILELGMYVVGIAISILVRGIYLRTQPGQVIPGEPPR